MREEVARIIRHFKLSATLKVLKVCSIICLVFTFVIGVFSQYPQEDFFFNFFIRLTFGFAVVGFIYSCKRLFLENSSVQLYNTKMLDKLTVEENFELILTDKRIHEEVMRFIPSVGEIPEIENSRYASVRFNHFLTWFQKNISNVEKVCELSEFKGDMRERFCKEQSRYFNELMVLCSDDEDMLENVRKAEGYVNAYLYKDNVA